MHRIEIGDTALEETGALRAFDGRKILDAIEEQLAHDPSVPTRRRKLLPELEPPFDAAAPVWQLSVGEYRVYYDVNEEEKVVHVRAVRRKPSHRTTEEIL